MINTALYNELLNHGKQCLPFEACGFLAGTGDIVKSLWRLQNEWQSDRRFFVSKRNVEAALQKIETAQQEVLAIYHTHPSTNPVPSQYDILHHPDPNVKMVIVSYKEPTATLRGYKISRNHYTECPIFVKSTP